MVMDDKAVEPPAKRLKAAPAPPPLGEDYVAADSSEFGLGWVAHKGGEWLYNKEEKTYFHLPSGALHMETEAGLISLNAGAEAEPEEPAAPALPSERRKGTVKWFNDKKGFGFIEVQSSDGSDAKDLFVHRNQLVGADGDPFASLETGAKVSYSLGETDNGRACAVEVQLEAGGAEDDDAADDDDGASSGSEVEIDLEAELKSGMHTLKGATKDHCEDFAVQSVKLPISLLGETAVCIFYGVFDGHGGFTCAEFAAAHLGKNILSRLRDRAKGQSDEVAIKNALAGGIKQTEHNFVHHAKFTKDNSGTTACTMAVYGPDENMRLRLYLANVETHERCWAGWMERLSG